MSDWTAALTRIRDSGATLEAGLSRAELAAAERAAGAEFPPDLAEFLGAALPSGAGYPNWRAPDSPAIAERLGWPFRGLAFDIEHNAFWWPAWGERPAALADALDEAKRHFSTVPVLIPLFVHRYIPSEPRRAGNPVLSVYQTDVIYYGRDLDSYWQHEFEGLTYDQATSIRPRKIPFWSELIDAD